MILLKDMKNFRIILASFLVVAGWMGLAYSYRVPEKISRFLFSCPDVVGYYNGSWNGNDYHIGAFYGDFEKCPENPILSPIPNSWESRHVKDPYAIRYTTEEEVWLYYAATDGLGSGYYIGVAFSKDGVHFDRNAHNPLFY